MALRILAEASSGVSIKGLASWKAASALLASCPSKLEPAAKLPIMRIGKLAAKVSVLMFFIKASSFQETLLIALFLYGYIINAFVTYTQ